MSKLSFGCFNSRSREGSDGASKRIPKSDIPVSTRAPVKGATSYGAKSMAIGSRFNSRSREGSDAEERKILMEWEKFQLALP